MISIYLTASFMTLSVMMAPTSTAGQSRSPLREAAKKEKERRLQIRQAGDTVRVFSERDLVQGESTDQGSAEQAVGEEKQAEDTGPSNTEIRAEVTLNSTIHLATPLRERNRVFGRMRELYFEEVVNIDLTIRANRRRIEAIDRELATIGLGGLPVVQTADQARMPYNGTKTPELTSEKSKLERDNERLETRKVTLKESLLEKGRRGGIAPGRLVF